LPCHLRRLSWPVRATTFFTYFNVTGEGRMKSVCSKVTPGISSAKFKDFVEEWK